MSGTSIKPNALALKDFTTKTIVDGVLAIDASYHVVAAEGGTTDDLDTMTPDFTTLSVNGTNYGPLVLLIADAGDTITMKHSAATNGFDLPDDTDYPLTDDSLIVAAFNYADSLWRIAGADVSPTITDFTDAQHDHADAVGGGNTLTIPTIADFTNATHTHADAAGGGNTLTIPTIGDFTNAAHDHADAAGGAQIDPATALSAAVAIAQGGTGQAAKEAAFDALSPVTTEGDIIYRNATVNTRLAKGAATEVLTMNAGATAPEWAAASSGLFSSFAIIQDSKATTTAGGTFTLGAWRTRDLQTEQYDPDGIVSIAANQFTLAAGTYFIKATAPFYKAGYNAARIYNTTDASTELEGQNTDGNAASAVAGVALVEGVFTLGDAKVLELQHQSTATQATNGFGLPHSFGGTEVYSIVEIWKVT